MISRITRMDDCWQLHCSWGPQQEEVLTISTQAEARRCAEFLEDFEEPAEQMQWARWFREAEKLAEMDRQQQEAP